MADKSIQSQQINSEPRSSEIILSFNLVNLFTSKFIAQMLQLFGMLEERLINCSNQQFRLNMLEVLFLREEIVTPRV